MQSSIPEMAAMGLLTSVVAPLLVVALRRRAVARLWAAPAAAALPGFLGLHALVMLVFEGADRPVAVRLLALLLLLAGGLCFWSPVVGTRRRLADDGSTIYLFLAAPALDIPAVIMIAQGDSVGGLTMIVAMLPIGVFAVAHTWRWISAEEHLSDGPLGRRTVSVSGNADLLECQ